MHTWQNALQVFKPSKKSRWKRVGHFFLKNLETPLNFALTLATLSIASRITDEFEQTNLKIGKYFAPVTKLLGSHKTNTEVKMAIAIATSMLFDYATDFVWGRWIRKKPLSPKDVEDTICSIQAEFQHIEFPHPIDKLVTKIKKILKTKQNKVLAKEEATKLVQQIKILIEAHGIEERLAKDRSLNAFFEYPDHLTRAISWQNASNFFSKKIVPRLKTAGSITIRGLKIPLKLTLLWFSTCKLYRTTEGFEYLLELIEGYWKSYEITPITKITNILKNDFEIRTEADMTTIILTSSLIGMFFEWGWDATVEHSKHRQREIEAAVQAINSSTPALILPRPVAQLVERIKTIFKSKKDKAIAYNEATEMIRKIRILIEAHEIEISLTKA